VSASLTLYYQRGRWDLSTTCTYNANFLTDYGDSRALDLDRGRRSRQLPVPSSPASD
jgi:hypothetical protein